MDSAGVVRRVINRPRDVITRNPAMNPDVKPIFNNFLLNLVFHRRHYWMYQTLILHTTILIH